MNAFTDIQTIHGPDGAPAFVVLPYAEFIGKVVHVEQPSAQHLYWPDLDIDLAVESIRHPERFPLIACVQAD